MSIVTQLPNVSAQTRAFISGRSKGTWHGDLYMQTGGRGRRERGGRWEKGWVGIQVVVWACLQTNAEFRIKRLD